MTSVPNPLTILKKEADSISAVITQIDANIEELKKKIEEVGVQRHSLNLVVTAIDNEMDRLRNNGVEEQLELPLSEDPE
jgi:hypothetical protein